MKTANTIKGKSKKELLKLLNEKRGALQSFKYELAGGKSKNTKKGRNIRKEIAQLMTEITIADKNEVVAAPVKTVEAKATKIAKTKTAKK